MGDMTKRGSYAQARRAINVSIVLNVLLMGTKTVIGYIGNSSAMVADGVHSMSDFLTDIVVLIGTKFAAKPEDENHPYGHGKVETFAALTIALSLLLVAVGILYSSITNIFDGKELATPHMITLIAALISVIVKELLFRYTIHIGKKINSSSLIANAWHHRSDAYSSLAAMAGIIGAMMGFKALDSVAATLVAFLIGKVGIDIGRESFMDLIDTAASQKVREQIHEIIKSNKRVANYHNLKTRKVGSRVIADLHIEINPSISVVQGHNIAMEIKSKVIETVSDVKDILIHIEPEGDHLGAVYDTCRDVICQRADDVCRGVSGVLGLHSLKIHQFNGDIVLNIDIEVDPLASVADGHEIARAVKSALMDLDDNIKDVVVHIDPHGVYPPDG